MTQLPELRQGFGEHGVSETFIARTLVELTQFEL